MKNLFLKFILFFLITQSYAQDTLRLKYLGSSFEKTKNDSYINKKMLFVTNMDSIYINLKVPFDKSRSIVLDNGIFYGCELQINTVYSLIIRKVCLTAVPKEYNSYYKTNTVFHVESDSSFIEIQNNTKIESIGRLNNFVDINSCLYEILNLQPNNTCKFQH